MHIIANQRITHEQAYTEACEKMRVFDSLPSDMQELARKYGDVVTDLWIDGFDEIEIEYCIRTMPELRG